MRDLNHDFKELWRQNRDGSYATQVDREHILDVVANQLHDIGHRGLRAQGDRGTTEPRSSGSCVQAEREASDARV